MTKSDRILAALQAELDCHRLSLDCDRHIHSVRLIVKLNAGGFPVRVLFSAEAQRDLPNNKGIDKALIVV